jgi:hypothetical protein
VGGNPTGGRASVAQAGVNPKLSVEPMNAFQTWPHSLVVRTLVFHTSSQGSIPCGATCRDGGMVDTLASNPSVERRVGSTPTLGTMNEKQAKQLASEIKDSSRGVYAKVGHAVTNGEKKYVVHVTHKAIETEGKRWPYTLSAPE